MFKCCIDCDHSLDASYLGHPKIKKAPSIHFFECVMPDAEQFGRIVAIKSTRTDQVVDHLTDCEYFAPLMSVG